MKRSINTKRRQKSDIVKVQKKIWELCKQIVRQKYQIGDSWVCYTCGKPIYSRQDAHTAHFIPKSVCGLYLRYNLANLRVCCMSCNVYGGGQGALFYRHMVEEMGQSYVDNIFRDKQRVVKERPMIFYENLLAEYEGLVK